MSEQSSINADELTALRAFADAVAKASNSSNKSSNNTANTAKPDAQSSTAASPTPTPASLRAATTTKQPSPASIAPKSKPKNATKPTKKQYKKRKQINKKRYKSKKPWKKPKYERIDYKALPPSLGKNVKRHNSVELVSYVQGRRFAQAVLNDEFECPVVVVVADAVASAKVAMNPDPLSEKKRAEIKAKRKLDLGKLFRAVVKHADLCLMTLDAADGYNENRKYFTHVQTNTVYIFDAKHHVIFVRDKWRERLDHSGWDPVQYEHTTEERAGYILDQLVTGKSEIKCRRTNPVATRRRRRYRTHKKQRRRYAKWRKHMVTYRRARRFIRHQENIKLLKTNPKAYWEKKNANIKRPPQKPYKPKYKTEFNNSNISNNKNKKGEHPMAKPVQHRPYNPSKRANRPSWSTDADYMGSPNKSFNPNGQRQRTEQHATQAQVKAVKEENLKLKKALNAMKKKLEAVAPILPEPAHWFTDWRESLRWAMHYCWLAHVPAKDKPNKPFDETIMSYISFDDEVIRHWPKGCSIMSIADVLLAKYLDLPVPKTKYIVNVDIDKTTDNRTMTVHSVSEPAANPFTI